MLVEALNPVQILDRFRANEFFGALDYVSYVGNSSTNVGSINYLVPRIEPRGAKTPEAIQIQDTVNHILGLTSIRFGLDLLTHYADSFERLLRDVETGTQKKAEWVANPRFYKPLQKDKVTVARIYYLDHATETLAHLTVISLYPSVDLGTAALEEARSGVCKPFFTASPGTSS